MAPGDEKPGHGEQPDDRVADKREIQVAGAGAVRVERRSVLPALAGNRAAAKHDSRPQGNLLSDHLKEFFQALLTAAKRKSDQIAALVGLGQFRLLHRLLIAYR